MNGRAFSGRSNRKRPPNFLTTAVEEMENISTERLVLEVEPGISVPLLLLRPQAKDGKATPVVVGIAQSGKEGFLRHRPKEIAKLLSSGITVCLPDLRGTGETKGGNDRGQSSAATARSSTELMLGGTMVGARLRDLRALLISLRGRDDLDRQRIALWGDSFASVNAADTNVSVPRRVDGRANPSEPLGGLIALLGALFENDVHAVYVHGALDGFHSVLASQQVLIPHDIVVPGALTAGDLCDVVSVLAPRPCRLDGLVDGLNRRLPIDAAREIYQPATKSYASASAQQRLSITAEDSSPADWLRRSLNVER